MHQKEKKTFALHNQVRRYHKLSRFCVHSRRPSAPITRT